MRCLACVGLLLVGCGGALAGPSEPSRSLADGRAATARSVSTACLDRDAPGIERAHRVDIAPDGRSARFCLASCVAVDLASGAVSEWSPGDEPEAATVRAPDGAMDVVQRGGRVEACTREATPRCTPLDGVAWAAAVGSAAVVAGVVVVARPEMDDTMATWWTISGHDAGSGAELYRRMVVEDGGLSEVRAVGPYALFHALTGTPAFLFEPRTGAELRPLAPLPGELAVLDAGPGRFVVTDDVADEVDVVRTGTPVSPRIALVARGVRTTIAIRGDVLVAVAGLGVDGSREHAGEVVVLDLAAGTIRARHAPPICRPSR